MADERAMVNPAEVCKELRATAYHNGDNFLRVAAGCIEGQQTKIERLELETRKSTAEIERLQRIVKDRDEWNDHLSQTVSFLLLAIPRPFRMAVNRKAVRLLEEEARRG